jgi:hypothetical protein
MAVICITQKWRGTMNWIAAAVFLLGTIVFFTLSEMNRAKIYAALKASHGGEELGFFDLSHGDTAKVLSEKRVVTPEALWTYDAEYLEKFTSDMRRSDAAALDRFINKVLRRWDAAFAVCLALFTALLNFSASTLLVAHPLAARAMLVLAAMGLVYGVADVAEDFKLASILERSTRAEQVEHVDGGEAAVANMLTRVKVVSLILSGTGVVTFWILHGTAGLVTRFGPGADSPLKRG